MIVERSGGFAVRMYTGVDESGREIREWLGTFPTRPEAEEVEALARAHCHAEVQERAIAARAKRRSLTVRAGHHEARRLFPQEPCEICGDPLGERHHRDGNPLHNERDNIVFLCHRHHRQAHGPNLPAAALEQIALAGDLEHAQRIARAAIRATEFLHRTAAWDGDE